MRFYVSVPRAASYAVTVRLGLSKQTLLPGLDPAESVIAELLDCMELPESGATDKLLEPIPADAYRRNFLRLVRRIAPDGEDIRAIGFTAGSGRRERRAVDAGSTPHKIIVLEGLMDDIVRPYWDSTVKVERIRQKRQLILLTYIQPVEDV